MSNPQKRLYEFGQFVFDPSERLLRQNGDHLQLSPKVCDTLVVLIEEAGHTVGYEELIRRVWPDTSAGKNNLDQNIFQLRKLLDDRSADPRYIKTVPKLGYQFVAPVRESAPNGQPAPTPAQSQIQKRESDRKPYVSAADSTSLADSDLTRRSPAVAAPPRARAKTSRWFITGVVLIVLFPLTAFILRRQFQARRTTMEIVKLTSDGKATTAAISPDGKTIAYGISEGGRSSLWLKSIDGGESKQLIQLDQNSLYGLVFSNDGSSLFYNREVPEGADLYQLQLADGSQPVKVLDRVDSRITLSPDGEQLAFYRQYWSEGEGVLLIANIDGTQERKLLTSNPTSHFLDSNGPAWSLDGKTIIAITEGASTNETSIMQIDVADGTARRISIPSDWPRLRDVAWLPDGSGLVLIVSEGGPTATTQIWQLSYPGSVATKLTESSKVQESLSLAKTSDAQVTIERDSPSDIWVTTPGAKMGEMKAITLSGKPGRAGLCWRPDGRIVYHSQEAGKDTLWSLNADGSEPKALTPDSSGNFLPSISGDGRQLVFASRRTGVLHVWRMDLDSGAQMQLTGGSEEQWPQISADGQWAYYNSWDNGAGNVWKISINGGQPIKVIAESSYHPQPAPNGQFLAYEHLTQEPQKSSRKIVPEKGGPVMYSFAGALARLSPTRWSRDGRALLYLDQRDGAWNIWSQPLTGGEPSQLTHFTEGRIYYFDQSWDGKRLAVSQGKQSKDVVLRRGN